MKKIAALSLLTIFSLNINDASAVKSGGKLCESQFRRCTGYDCAADDQECQVNCRTSYNQCVANGGLPND